MSHRSKMMLAARRLRQNLSVDAGIEGPYQWGTVASISTGAPSTLGVYLDSSSSVSGAVITTGIPYLSTYTPAVGDVVLIARMSGAARTQRVVVGNLSTYGVDDFGPSAAALGAGGGSGQDIHYTNLLHGWLTPSNTGTLKISMPTTAYKIATMQHIVIRGYDYSNNRGPWTVIVGGYNYSDGNWYNFNARIIGRAPFHSVRLAQDGTRNCILLGDTTTTWTYGQFEVADFYALLQNQSPSIWASGWASSVLTVETGITNIFPCVLDQYTDSSTGGLMVSCDGAGTFAPTSFGSIPVKIAEATPGGTPSLTFTSIPQGFRHLYIDFAVRSTTASSFDEMAIRFNGDSGANYTYARTILGASYIFQGSGATGQTSCRNWWAVAASSLANMPTYGRIQIQGYSGTTFLKRALVEWPWTAGASFLTSPEWDTTVCFWNNTAAINQIQIFTSSGANYAAGSVFTLYGIP